MEFFNATFQQSTIRPDDSIVGAILVDSILLRESELPYGDTTNIIPAESIKDENFINALNGLLVFKEHPTEMVKAGNFNSLAKESIGTIFNAHYAEVNGDKCVMGTLRISNPNAVAEISAKRIKGGSLGYMANVVNENDNLVQRNLVPNHFCITYNPRDKEVVLLNSKKGDSMNKEEVMALIQEVTNSQKQQDEIRVPKAIFNSFMQVIATRIEDKQVVEFMNSKEGVDKMQYLDSVLSIKNVFNSETSKAIEELKNENEELKKEAEEKANECDKDEKENDDTQNVVAEKNSDDEGEKKEDEPKEEKDNSCEEKTNSYVGFAKQEVKNSDPAVAKARAELNARLAQIL